MWDPSPYNVKCDEYDDDGVFDEADCSGHDMDFCAVRDDGSGNVRCIDSHAACYRGNKNGTAFHQWCGSACDEHWGAYCLWDAWSNPKELCAGRSLGARATQPRRQR